jgi:anti-anti-sigma regulatory factor
MSDPITPTKSIKHHWDIDSRCLTLMNPLSCDEPAECTGKVFSEHYGHSLGPDVTITVDVSHVDEFDTSGIAFLVMLRHRLIDSKTKMRIIGTSPKLDGVISLLGLSKELGTTHLNQVAE